MSINLEENINLIHDFLNNNINNCYSIDNIKINKIKLDDIRISDNKLNEDLLKQLFNNGQFQFLFEINKELYYKIYSNSFPLIIKISLENLNRANNDSLITYILSEMALKDNINILLPILNLDVKLSSIKKLLDIRSTKDFKDAKESKIIQIKLREGFNKITLSNEYIKNDKNFKYNIFLFLIIFTLAKIKNKYPQFKHNNLILSNILIEEKLENKNEFKLDNLNYELPKYNFNPKITNFEESYISDKTVHNTNQNILLEEITDNDEDIEISINNDRNDLRDDEHKIVSTFIDERDDQYNEVKDESYNDKNNINYLNNIDDMIKLSKDILKENINLNLETKKFLNKIIETNKMKKTNYNNLLNDEYFDEFKSISNQSKVYKGLFSTKLKNSKDDTLGNQKNIFTNQKNIFTNKRNIKPQFIEKIDSEVSNIYKDEEPVTENSVYSSKRNIKSHIVENIDSKAITLYRNKKLFTENSDTEISVYSSKRNIKKHDTENNELVGGYDKTITAPYKNEKNTPFITNDERSTFKKKSMENPPREPPVLLEQKIYDTSKSKPPPPQVPPAYVPVYDEVGSAIAQIPQFNNMTGPNPAYAQPFQKVYNINLSNPISNFTTINRVFEDILPGDPRTLSFTTIYERIQLKNYMRTLILNTKDGEEMTVNGGKNSILSYIKLMDINPYTLNKNPFEDLAKNFLIFRAAYPIRYDNQSKSIEISKQAVGLNIRLYNMSIGEVRAETINNSINKFEFDLWREIEFYREIRDNVIMKNVSPNFISMILYKVDSKSVLDWNKLSVGRNSISYSNSYKINALHDLKELSVILNKNKIAPNSVINIFWISNISNDKNSFWLNIELELKNNKQFNLLWIDPSKVEFNKFINDRNVTKYPTLLIEYNSSFKKYGGDQNVNSLINFINTELLYTNKLDITISSGHTLLLVTEAPNTSIIKWASPIYEGFGSQCKMISTGYRSAEVWRSVIFQIIYILTVLQEKDIYFRELKIENNFYIKDLFYDQTTTNYWIYNIDGIEYYVPNYGYLVLFDSKYSDINSIVNNNNPNQREFKICSNKLFVNKNGSFSISNNDVFYYLQLKEILSSYNFQTKLPSLGTHTIDPVICTLINNIEANSYNNKIKNIFIDQFKEYLNNRVGTSLMVSEKEIVNAYYKPNLNPGKLLVYRERFDLYKWVIYKKLNIQNNKHIIITKDNNNRYSEIEIHQNKLIGFPPNEKINLNNITDNNIIEKFFFGNIV